MYRPDEYFLAAIYVFSIASHEKRSRPTQQETTTTAAAEEEEDVARQTSPAFDKLN
jgi:hypothetical protein